MRPEASRTAAPGARWLPLWLAWLIVSLAPAASAQAVQAVDDKGKLVNMKAPAQRVVALGPHLVELVYAAGGGDRLVGVQRFSDFPAAAQRLPVVGDALALNLEAIALLRPDLVVVWGSGVNARQQQRLASLGVPVFVSEITQVAHMAHTLRRLGTLLGQVDTAEQAARQVQTDWASLQRRYAGRPPVRVFYQLWHEPLMTVNRKHLLHEAITLCGGVNVFGDLAPLVPTVGWEAAVAANPELVLTGQSPEEPARLEAWLRFPQVAAVQRRQLVALDGPALARMSPRFVAASMKLCAAIDAARR